MLVDNYPSWIKHYLIMCSILQCRVQCFPEEEVGTLTLEFWTKMYYLTSWTERWMRVPLFISDKVFYDRKK